MANIFLDANTLIDLLSNRNNRSSTNFVGHTVKFSTLSIHIYCYVSKITMPKNDLLDTIKDYYLVTLTKKIARNALDGPTIDFEDNIQLHSAAQSDCDIFFTNDKELLKLAYFGKVKITNKLD